MALLELSTHQVCHVIYIFHLASQLPFKRLFNVFCKNWCFWFNTNHWISFLFLNFDHLSFKDHLIQLDSGVKLTFFEFVYHEHVFTELHSHQRLNTFLLLRSINTFQSFGHPLTFLYKSPLFSTSNNTELFLLFSIEKL